MNTPEIQALLAELIQAQQGLLLASGQERIPTLTSEDVLQPNDYPVLENDPQFRYEEGVLAGLLTVQAALRALYHLKNEGE